MYRQISHEVKTSDNKIWSGNRICQEKYFSSKVMQKLKHGDYFQTSFFLEILCMIFQEKCFSC